VSVHSADCDWLPIDAEQACSREKRSSFSAFSGGYVCPEPVLADGHVSPENSSVQSHDPKTFSGNFRTVLDLRFAEPDPAENRIFEPFIYKNDHFAKTGSGQT
jgi:hypothetical protein